MEMSWVQAVILGFLQGVTEFFPVSSSAHLKMARLLFGIENAEGQVLFDLSCHLGTLIAVLLFLKNEIIELFRSERKKLALLCIALFPLIPSYFLLKPLRDFVSRPEYLGICLMATSGILFLGHKYRLRREKNDSMKRQVSDALWIGALQSTALIPGISRSASTISTARFLGWDAPKAVRFSFLLSIPTIVGGNGLELVKMALSSPTGSTVPYSLCCLGFFSSCIAGVFVIRRAVSFLERGKLKPFAWYCLIIGSFAYMWWS
jgi:undecaprenyl-diphosphatase